MSFEFGSSDLSEKPEKLAVSDEQESNYFEEFDALSGPEERDLTDEEVKGLSKMEKMKIAQEKLQIRSNLF